MSTSHRAIKAPTAAERILERDLGAPVEAWLQSQSYVASKEVKHLGKIADFVGVRGTKLITVEMKTEVTLALLTQAAHWIPYVNESWIAVPEKPINDVRAYGYRICREQGIGVLTVRPLSKVEQSRQNQNVDLDVANTGLLARVTVVMQAVTVSSNEVDTTPFHDILRPEHQTFSEAGTKSGLRVGPFQDMCQSVRDLLQASGGAATLEDVAKRAKRPSKAVVELLKSKRIPGVRLDGSGLGPVMVRLCEVGNEASVMNERASKSRPARYVPGMGMVQV
jgi:hypothetical protein